MFFKKKKEVEKDPFDWTGLTLKLTPQLRQFNGRFDRTKDILIFYNGMLAIPSYDYSFTPTEISFTKFVPSTYDNISIVQLSINTRRDIILNEKTYKQLLIRGDKKTLDI